MRSVSENTIDAGHREAIRQIIAPGGEARPDERHQITEDSFFWAEDILCEQIARAHCIPLNALKSSRPITSTIQETEVGREDNSEEASWIVSPKATLWNNDNKWKA